MDILSQYNKEHPETSQEQKQTPITDQYGRAYTGMTAFIIRTSGGRIRDARRALRILLIAGVVVFAVSITIFLYNLSGSGTSPNPARNIDQRQFSSGK